jgi:hypothetical protein
LSGLFCAIAGATTPAGASKALAAADFNKARRDSFI